MSKTSIIVGVATFSTYLLYKAIRALIAIIHIYKACKDQPYDH